MKIENHKIKQKIEKIILKLDPKQLNNEINLKAKSQSTITADTSD